MGIESRTSETPHPAHGVTLGAGLAHGEMPGLTPPSVFPPQSSVLSPQSSIFGPRLTGLSGGWFANFSKTGRKRRQAQLR